MPLEDAWRDHITRQQRTKLTVLRGDRLVLTNLWIRDLPPQHYFHTLLMFAVPVSRVDISSRLLDGTFLSVPLSPSVAAAFSCGIAFHENRHT